jgi:hypothetical protein
MLEALNMPDLRFLVILFDLKPNELLPSALVESILALPDLNADTPEIDPLKHLSADSSGTNVPTRDVGTMGSRRRQRDRRTVWDRILHSHGTGSAAARGTSDARTTAGDISWTENAELAKNESF